MNYENQLVKTNVFAYFVLKIIYYEIHPMRKIIFKMTCWRPFFIVNNVNFKFKQSTL